MKRSLLIFAVFLGLSCQSPRITTNTSEYPHVVLPGGFEYEHLYSPSVAKQGTWVALAFDDKGRLYAADQHGSLYRMDIQFGRSDVITPQEIDLEIGRANGLLWAFDALYVVVNSDEERAIGERASGVYRVTDSDGDDMLDAIEAIQTFEGAGEHGPHSIILSPDGESLYMIAGNHTDLPESYTKRHPGEWKEDQLLPYIIDPRGHANDRMAPGGWVARMNPDGSDFEVIGIGFRNAFDIAFNADGELFTFDADMEWDMGMPWYRPIRVNHVTSASEFGWRTGSGKWPAYYPDNLPAVVDIGQGSPTGVLIGEGSTFPAKYQRSLFVFDWSFGTIYRVEMTPDGSSYTGTFEEFLSGVPLPVTDGVWGPDGAMYFATGGRSLESHLYRVKYTGDESIASIDGQTHNADQRNLRRSLERLHGQLDPSVVSFAWPYLNHEDRFIQYAARIAIEHQPASYWWQRVMDEENPARKIQAIVALARQGESSHQYAALKTLTSIDYVDLSTEDKLDIIRAYGLVFIRLGEPADHWRSKIANELMGDYPSDNYVLNKELSVLLAYLEAPGYVSKTLALLEAASSETMDVPILTEELTSRHERYGKDIENMKANMPSAPEIAYAYSLSHAGEGWTMRERERYFQWFYDAMARSGGRSYVGFIDQIRRTALEHVNDEEKEALAELVVEFNQPALDMSKLPQPEGPGTNWMQGQVRKLLNEQLDESARNYEQGKKMYAAALCETCHTMNGDGGNIGPDLSQIGTRFGRGDIVEAIISPSDGLTDQYAATVYSMKDGSTIIGRVIRQDDSTITVNVNPFDLSQTTSIDKSQVESEKESPASLMPAGLINRLNADEVMDLMAYLISNGDPDHDVFHDRL